MLKPPKTGNCSVSEDKPHQPLVTLAELKTIYKNPKRSDLSESIKSRLSKAVQHDNWTLEDVIEHDNNDPEVARCVMYLVTAKLTRRIMNTVKCLTCKDALLNSENSANLPEAVLTDSLTTGPLTHPNTHFYRFIHFLEQRFLVHRDSMHVFESILDDVYQYEKLSFPCTEHASDILLNVVQCYVTMRMQQYCARINAEQLKNNRIKKKTAKFCKT